MGYANGVFTPPAGAENALPKDVIQSVVWNSIFTSISTALTTIGTSVCIECVISDSPEALFPGIKGYLECPLAVTIDSWKLMGDKSGSVVVDIWKVPFGSFPPTSSNSITGSAQPTISSSVSGASSALTGWTTSISKGDILAININSCNAVQQITLSLSCGRN